MHYHIRIICDFNDAYIVAKGKISVRGTNDANKINKNLTFKNSGSFRWCMSKINNTFINNEEDLDIVMPMYNLLEYGNNYSMTLTSLWNCYRDKVNYSANETDDNDHKINNNKTTTNKFFESKTKIIGSTSNSNNVLDAEVTAPLKYLSNFWKSSDLPLIDCEIKLDLRWTKNCVISEISKTFRAVGDPPA